MEDWKFAWREGIAPELTRAELVALRDALAADAPELVQGRTTEPPAFPGALASPCERACLVGYAGWKGRGCHTVGQVEAFFRRTVVAADGRFDERGEVRWLLEFWDTTPRAEAVAALLPEVERALAELDRRS